ncbi:hypothetical protein [Legionella pneumophila]|uniref:hypothetical protein n=1 Tax=Legionella pneumophila TaxID=446 RepID=UPI0007707FB6|nr:hypothetical protein [Legionella pneumophila]CZP45628.1 Uncharacterised protein [Legionella pneumophila]
MKHAVKITLALLFLGSYLNDYCYAYDFNSSQLVSECQKISTHLREIVRKNRNSYCVGDIESVASSLERTGKKLEYDKPERILAAIKYAELELKQIKNNRSYCTQFTSLISPIINEVKNTGYELEIFMNSYLAT